MILKMNGVIKHLFPVSSEFGELDSVHPHGHVGIDIAMPSGTDILSPADGIVSQVVNQGNVGLGKGIFIKLQDGKELVFGHLSKVDVQTGDVVHFGQKIADSGNTGHSTGAHLHIALKDHGHFLNPEKYATLMTKLDQPSKWEQFKDILHSPFDAVESSVESVKEFFAPFRDFFVWGGNVVRDIKTKGFLQWTEEQLYFAFKELFQLIVYLDDLVFLMPAIAFMATYFLIGKNKTTKWIVPLWFGYFVAEMINATLQSK